MTQFEACGIIEGFTGANPSAKQTVKAWAYLIKTGACWSLQGWYGRSAQHLIDGGYITKSGRVNWHELRNQNVEGI